MKGGFGIKKYLKVRNDIVFKALIHENKEYLKKIVKEALKIEIEEIQFYSAEQTKDRKEEKGKILDCLVLSNNKLINIEINNNYYKGLRERNMSYVAKLYSNNINVGETYKEMPEIYQINFTWGLKEEVIRRKYKMIDIENIDKKEYIENLEIVEINMDKIKEKIYNENEEYKYTKILNMDEKELREYDSEGDEIVDKCKRIVDKLAKDKNLFFHDFISPEEDAKKINMTYYANGKEEGTEETTKQAALNLYKNGASKELIYKSLNISEEKLEEILNNNKE